MVDLGPLGPWSDPPDMAVLVLERWHAAWERDHPELLGTAGPSFYGRALEPQPAGRRFPTKGGYSAGNTPACDLPFPEALMQKPQPPPGPGAATTAV